jgi:hypothetical protein
MYSTPVRSTAPKKNNRTTLNWWEYWVGHCWMTGWQSIGINFRVWADLIGSSYENYALLKDVDPEQECIEWFWVGLNDDDVYPKEFLEGLMQMMDRIDRGEEKLIPLDEDFFDRLKELTDGVELNKEDFE